MPIRNPAEAHQVFADALTSGDLESLLALYEPTATVVPQPGQVAKGSAALRGALQGFLALQPKITVETKGIIQAGDIALLRAKWRLIGTGPEGKPTEMTGNSIEVVRRQPDGAWCFVIDLPFGTD